MAKTQINKRFLELPLDPADVTLTPTNIVAAINSLLGSTEWQAQLTQEEVEDYSGNLITGGTQTGIVVTYNDALGTIDFDVTGATGLTQEQVEDIVGSLVVAGTGITSTYDDIAGTLVIGLTGVSYTQLEKDKLAGIANSATANDTNASLRDRSTHTGTQLSSTISDISFTISNNPSVVANTLKHDYPPIDAVKLSGIEDNATADQTPEEIRDALQTLSGTDRLDASYIKNLPAGTTNLSWSSNTTQGSVESSTGANANIPSATPGVSGKAGLLSRDDKDKLDTVELNASADQTPTEITFALDSFLGNVRWKVQEVPIGGTTGQVLKKNSNTDYDLVWASDNIGGGGGGATQLSELTDVNTSTPINKNVLIADGTDFESRALVVADISDFSAGVAATSAVAANTLKNSYPIIDSNKVGNITITAPKNLDNIEDNATADQTGAEIEGLLDTELGNVRWKEAEIPTGGTTGQVLAKNSGTNYDVAFVSSTIGNAILDISDPADKTGRWVISAGTSGINSGNAFLWRSSVATPTIDAHFDIKLIGM